MKEYIDENKILTILDYNLIDRSTIINKILEITNK